MQHFADNRWRQICKDTKLQQNFVFTVLLFDEDVENMLFKMRVHTTHKQTHMKC